MPSALLTTGLSLLLALTASGHRPSPFRQTPSLPRQLPINSTKPPAFFLAGDSMTAIQTPGGGGYGLGFLSFLRSPAWGVDYGQNGATTVSYRAGGRRGEPDCGVGRGRGREGGV